MIPQQQQVSNALTLHHEYQRQGWSLVAIPPGTKGPSGPESVGWNLRENALPHDIELLSGWGVGIAHAFSGTCSIDIDEWDRAVTYFAMNGIDLPQLFDAPDAVQISSGRQGRGKLLFKTPLGMVLPSKKIHYSMTDDDGKTKQFAMFELRCGTRDGEKTVQDVLPTAALHPDTGRPYVWAGKGDWRHLPQLPQPLFDLWQELIGEDTKRNISSEPSTFNASWAEIESAVMALDPDMARDPWRNVGMALHTTGHPDAFDLWDRWSKGSAEKYDARDIRKDWYSFRDDKPISVNLGTLFKYAYDAGWKRPPPDLKDLFKPVQQPPEEVIFDMEMGFPPPKIDLSLWPDVLARRAEQVGSEIGCDPTVPLMAGLAAVSAAVDKRTRLRITPTWTVPPVLWLMTVGAPSDKKSPGAKPMFAPLKQLEADDKVRYELAMHQWVMHQSRHAAQMKAYKEWAASPESGFPGAIPPQVDPLPPEPAALRLIINDSTSQKVVHMAAPRPRGFLMYLDEMHHYLKKINDPKGGDDRGTWIAGYESTSYTMDRVGTGTTHAENLAVSIYGNCQPDVFKAQMVAGSMDGLMQRFVPVVLDGKMTKMREKPLPDFMSYGPAYAAMIDRTFSLPQTEYECSPEADKQLELFEKWALDARADDILLNASPIYMTAMGKIGGLCSRLALLLHIIQHPDQKQLSAATMGQAVAIMRQFFVPALRYAFMEVVGLKDELAKWITNHIIQISGEQPIVSMRDLKQAAKRQLEGMPPWEAEEKIRATMDELAKADYVTLFTDHPKRTDWTVNPALSQQFAARRKAIILAKQRTIERFKDEAIKRVGFADPRYHADAIGIDSVTDG